MQSINELNVKDKSNQKITQEWLDEFMDYLNGNRFIPGTEFAARNTVGSMVKGQRHITANVQRGFGKKPEDVVREQNRALTHLDKEMLTKIIMINRYRLVYSKNL